MSHSRPYPARAPTWTRSGMSSTPSGPGMLASGHHEDMSLARDRSEPLKPARMVPRGATGKSADRRSHGQRIYTVLGAGLKFKIYRIYFRNYCIGIPTARALSFFMNYTFIYDSEPSTARAICAARISFAQDRQAHTRPGQSERYKSIR